MQRNFILFILLSQIVLAQTKDVYVLEYRGVEYGIFKDFNNQYLNNDFLKAEVTNPLIKFFVPNYFVLYKEGKKPSLETLYVSSVEFKKDRHNIIDIMKSIYKLHLEDTGDFQKIEKILKSKNKLKVTCSYNICNYEYINIVKDKSYNGILSFDKNNKIIKFTEKTKHITIRKYKDS